MLYIKNDNNYWKKCDFDLMQVVVLRVLNELREKCVRYMGKRWKHVHLVRERGKIGSRKSLRKVSDAVH